MVSHLNALPSKENYHRYHHGFICKTNLLFNLCGGLKKNTPKGVSLLGDVALLG